MQKGPEAGIRDIAKILHVAVFLNGGDHLTIAELPQAREDGDGHQHTQGVSGAPFLGVVVGDETVNQVVAVNPRYFIACLVFFLHI